MITWKLHLWQSWLLRSWRGWLLFWPQRKEVVPQQRRGEEPSGRRSRRATCPDPVTIMIARRMIIKVMVMVMVMVIKVMVMVMVVKWPAGNACEAQWHLRPLQQREESPLSALAPVPSPFSSIYFFFCILHVCTLYIDWLLKSQQSKKHLKTNVACNIQLGLEMIRVGSNDTKSGIKKEISGKQHCLYIIGVKAQVLCYGWKVCPMLYFCWLSSVMLGMGVSHLKESSN